MKRWTTKLYRNVLQGMYWGAAGYISYSRWMVLTLAGRKLPQYLSEHDSTALTAGLDYSQAAFSHYRPNGRAKQLLLLLRSAFRDIDRTNRLLIVGPRFENEIFLARGLGWHRSSISGLDLLAYSPLIAKGDMHSMPFRDSLFHSINFGWTISYSTDPLRAAREVTRVLAPKGYVALGLEVTDKSEAATDVGGLLSGSNRIQTEVQVKSLFPDMEVVAALAASDTSRDSLWLLRKA